MRDYSGIKSQSATLADSIEKQQKRISYKLFIWVILILMLGFFFVEQRLDYIRTEKRVRLLWIKKRNLESEILPLKLEEQYLIRLSKIESIARDELSLREANKRQIKKVIIQPEESAEPDSE
jgi:cell division protein FtsL